MTLKTIQPDGWAHAKGYANGMVSNDGILHIGGQIGWNEHQEFLTTDFVGQLEQTLQNIADITQAAGGAVSNISRLTWFIKDKREYLARQKEVGVAYQKVFGKHFPAMSVVVVADLLEEKALIEIEATAHLK